MAETLQTLLQEISACQICAQRLPLGANPVVRASIAAPIVIAGQAPGLKVHQTNIPFNDPSGDRLRAWMGIDRVTFYDVTKVNIIPMGFCYPGRMKKGGDNPPDKACAHTWHDRLFQLLPKPKLKLVIGRYAMDYHLKLSRKISLTETVSSWRDYAPDVFPMPHPSPRNQYWLKKNPWFEQELLPALRSQVRNILHFD